MPESDFKLGKIYFCFSHLESEYKEVSTWTFIFKQSMEE